MPGHRLSLFSLGCLLCATAVFGATSITLNVGAGSLPEGSFEEIPISTDAPLFTKLDVSVSDSTVLAVPASVTRSFGVT